MKKVLSFLILLLFPSIIFGQYRIEGYLINGADSSALPFKQISIPGLDTQTTDSLGFFKFSFTEEQRQAYYLKSGIDLYINVNIEDYVMIDPYDQQIRLPDNPDLQKYFTIVMVEKGSHLLLRSESMLEEVFKKRINAAIKEYDKEIARQIALATEATRLGFSEEELLQAIKLYKETLRHSNDLNKLALASLDDAQEANNDKERKKNLTAAKTNFLEAIKKDEATLKAANHAVTRLPYEYLNLGITYYEEPNYDSALHYFMKADILSPKDFNIKYWLGISYLELAKYDLAMSELNKAYVMEFNNFDKGILLNAIADVLSNQGKYDSALLIHREALQINEYYYGKIHPIISSTLNHLALVLSSQGRYNNALNVYQEIIYIDSLYIVNQFDGIKYSNVASRNIATTLQEQGLYDSALFYYNKIFDKSFIVKVYRLRGEEHYYQKRYLKAINDFNSALKLDSTQRENYYFNYM